MPTFVLRLNRVFIHDNRDTAAWYDWFNLFGTDTAEVKLYSFVTVNNQSSPDIDAMVAEKNPAEKQKLLKGAIQASFASRILTTIENVTDDHIMTFGPRGYVLYRCDEVPDMFHWSFVAVELDKDEREQGKMLLEVLNDDKFDGFAKVLLDTIGKASNPAYIAGMEIAKFISKVIGKAMARNKDDQIGIYYTSHIRAEDYSHGEFKINDVWDLTKNMRIDYSVLCFD